MARKRKLPLLENMEITGLAAEGKSIARWNDMVVFVKNTVPGDVVDIQISKKRKKYMEGFPVTFRSYSKARVEPFCSHFGICGGCKWQQLPYKEQLKYKEQQVIDNLTRIGKLELPKINPIIGSVKQIFYRNKLEYTFSATRWMTDYEITSGKEIDNKNALGFHIPGRFDRVLDIHHCSLQNELSNQIRNKLKEFTIENGLSYYHAKLNEGFMRNLIIRNTAKGETMVIVVFGYENRSEIELVMNYLSKEFPDLTALMYVVNTKLNDVIHDLEVTVFKGQNYIIEEMDDLKFRIGPKSFFQTNTLQALTLYRVVKEFARLTGKETVYDLYTGTGTIANFIAHECKKVIGIEYVPDAIEDAKVNSNINNIRNTCFFSGDLKDVFTSNFIKANRKPDVIITDPPRAGMHADVVQTILELEANRIVYVSCNPATQARDLQLLSEKYKIEIVQPVDMFPHTHHVENVVSLVLKNKQR